MQLWQDGLVAMLAAIGLASVMWAVVRAVLFSRLEQGMPGRLLLVDCGRSEEGRKLAKLLSREDRWVSVCKKDDIGSYLA